MGDKSPRSTSKKTQQKQSAAAAMAAKKKAVQDAKHVAPPAKK